MKKKKKKKVFKGIESVLNDFKGEEVKKEEYGFLGGIIYWKVFLSWSYYYIVV